MATNEEQQEQQLSVGDQIVVNHPQSPMHGEAGVVCAIDEEYGTGYQVELQHAVIGSTRLWFDGSALRKA